MGTQLETSLAREMASWESAGLRRRIEPGGGARGADFVSNDYLGLAHHQEVIEAAREALADFGAGGRASRLLGGGCQVHEHCEQAAADWLGAEAALLFPSGYQANIGLVGALVGRGDAIFSDQLCHASLIDAARLARARVHVHRHLDLEELEAQLERSAQARRRLVLTEGVFSMDGDAAPLADLARLCERFDAWLVVDEAHSSGLLGADGAGAWSALSFEPPEAGRLAARVVTGGKALGVSGALVVGSAELREHLINRARSFVFTTAPSPAVAGALERAIDLCRRSNDARERTKSAARNLATALGLVEPAAAIVPFVVGASRRAVEIARELGAQGLDVRAVRPPTVPADTARLRIVLHAFNTEAERDDLVRGLAGQKTSATVHAVPAARRSLFVVGTDTGVGKTVVSALLLRAARRLGPAAYWKPVQTGADSDTDAVEALASAAPHELLRPAWSLSLPASPHAAAAAEGRAVDLERLEQGLAGLLRTLPDARLVIELVGGLLVPYRTEPEIALQADWLERAAGAAVVLVARSGLGTLNHTLLTLEALRARHLEPRALFLVGEPHASNRETLSAIAGIERVIEIPHLDRLDAESLATWEAENDLSEVLEA